MANLGARARNRNGPEGLGKVVALTVSIGAGALLAAIAASTGMLSLGALIAQPMDLGLGLWPATLVASLLAFLLGRQGFVVRWREESTKISLDEVAVFLAAVFLPVPNLVLALAVASVATQLAHRRSLPKAAFNVAQYTLGATAAGLSVLALRALGVPPTWSALATPLLFSVTTSGLVSVVFSRLEGEPVHAIFTKRFLSFSIVAASLGAALGLTVLALAALSPWATLAAIPLFLHMRRFGRLTEWSDAELQTHQRLATLSGEAAGSADLDAVATRIVAACEELLSAGEVELSLDAQPAPRLWRSGDGSASTGGINARVMDARGISLGSITVYPKPGQRAFGEREQQLLRTVASSVASACANARALRESEAANAALKELEQELREANRAQHETIRRLENMNRELEEFTLWTTHDMREPLRSIGTIAQLLHEDLGNVSVEEAREMTRRIREGSDRLKERVKALHAFSLIVQRDDAFEDVDMQAVVDDVVVSMEAKVDERHAIIEMPQEALPIVRAQPARVHQVVANLVENALKYGHADHPRVLIGHERVGDGLRIFVQDNGPGIPPAYHQRIFQLFQRGPATTEPGSGAGLAIVKRIVEQHGGRVGVESAPGHGACFWFTLPLAPAPTSLAVR